MLKYKKASLWKIKEDIWQIRKLYKRMNVKQKYLLIKKLNSKDQSEKDLRKERYILIWKNYNKNELIKK